MKIHASPPLILWVDCIKNIIGDKASEKEVSALAVNRGVSRITEAVERQEVAIVASPSAFTLRNVGLVTLSSVLICCLAKFFYEYNLLKLHC